MRSHQDTVLSVAFTPNRQYALSGSIDKTLIQWDLEGDTDIGFLQALTG